MKAVTVYPHQPNSIHLTEQDKPTLDQVPNGRGVMVQVLRVGVDGTEAAAQIPGWLDRLLTHQVHGLEQYAEMMRLVVAEKNAIKVYVEVASDE